MAKFPALAETSSDEAQVDAESSNSQNVDSDRQKLEPKSHDAHLTVDEAREITIGSVDEVFTIESDNSPYPEVRANVPNVDDVELPINTVRMWFLGIVFTMVTTSS